MHCVSSCLSSWHRNASFYRVFGVGGELGYWEKMSLVKSMSDHPQETAYFRKLSEKLNLQGWAKVGYIASHQYLKDKPYLRI